MGEDISKWKEDLPNAEIAEVTKPREQADYSGESRRIDHEDVAQTMLSEFGIDVHALATYGDVLAVQRALGSDPRKLAEFSNLYRLWQEEEKKHRKEPKDGSKVSA